MACGIYKIVNKINGKIYIGSTRRLTQRKREHFAKLKENRGNSIIRSAVAKYGVDNFEFVIIEVFYFWMEAETVYIDEILTSREQYFVDTLKPEYNIKIKDVCSSKGIPRNVTDNKNTELSKREIKRRQINKVKKFVDVYSFPELVFIETIWGNRNCARLYNINTSYMASICKHGVSTSYRNNFIFCYQGNNILDYIKERKIHSGYKQANTKSIIQTDRQGNFIKEWRTIKDAETNLNLNKGSVSRVLSGEYKHTKNYFFKPKN
jgi:group I intron endonuclease